MAINTGYLTANKTDEADRMYTPFYAVEPIIKYLPKDKIIWCPFDEEEWSAYSITLKEHGYKVISSSLNKGQDFFTYQPEHWDVICSNPPFSKKDKILERLYSLGKPFAVLLPMNSLQGKSRYKYFKNGIQLLSFDQRIGFHNDGSMDRPIEGSPFASAYFCRGVLPEGLIVEELHKYDRSLRSE